MLRRFHSIAVLAAALMLSPFAGAQTLRHGDSSAELMPLYVVADDPAQHVVPGGVEDGVGDLIISTNDGAFRCTATLLTTGRHALTAAHCLTDSVGNLRANSATVKFPAAPSQTYNVSEFFVHPDWNGGFFRGNDIAVLEFDTEISTDVQRYGIDRNAADNVGLVGEKFGYGRSGLGTTGDTLGSGTRRTGLNRYDDFADTMLDWLGWQPGSYVPEAVLQYDFDNGQAANDAFDYFFGQSDLGTGDDDEVMAAPGDSGGPTLNDVKQITGVTSYSVRLTSGSGASSDIDSTLNRSFGEFGGDTSVAAYADFIDDLLGISATVGGDANLDGQVSLLDLDILGQHFLHLGSWTTGDFTGDGTVSILDLDVLGLNYGYGTVVAETTKLNAGPELFSSRFPNTDTTDRTELANPIEVPEPSTLGLLGLLSLRLLTRSHSHKLTRRGLC